MATKTATDKLNLNVTTNELVKMFNSINRKFYKGELPKVIITVQRKIMRRALGWFTINKIWKDANENEFFEIGISAEYLNRTPEEIFTTMLHESVHLYCRKNEIKDTSGYYHNKKFKTIAESHGLEITQAPIIGWSVSKLNEEGKKFFDSCKIKEDAFSLYRVDVPEFEIPTPLKPKKTVSNYNLYKYECSCGTKISKHLPLNIHCLDCGQDFVLVSKREGEKDLDS